MATPNYTGNGQPTANTSSWFGSLFGGTPNYVGAGQPVTGGSTFGAPAPAYKPVPVAAAPSGNGMTCGACGAAIVVQRCDTPIAIVIPRQPPCDPQQQQ